MDYNNIIRDPNEKTPQSSVFRFDSYPGQTNPYPFYEHNPSMHLQNTTPMFSSFIPEQQIPSPIAPPVPTSFSFGYPNSPMMGHFPHYTAPNDFSSLKPNKFNLGKRKTNSPPLQLYNKQHITEEKMAEYMSKLHINSETVPSVLEPESLKNKRLYMCEEMRKLQPEPLLPTSLLSKMQQPCTALVLWKPPSKVLPALLDNSKNTKGKDTEEDDDPPLDMDSEFIATMDMDS
ncbi:unnamed protein product [Ceutorhynchus assimilis]|uniref:Uncharacterized protein n=1 Tax=Ceutorhynchus assimilis TaxID=467358 RepID=A0A9N9MM57_9CUCU|nr:unnamed protein product [Ceutorhynchus assimilis]